MGHEFTVNKSPELSICISTFNRASVIGETLESILLQITDSCELIISDNASTDETRDVVSNYARLFPNVFYVKHMTNDGMDRNFDRAISLSRGLYCWLMPDDDILRPDAVKVILDALQHHYSLVLVNAEGTDHKMSSVVSPRFSKQTSDRVYRPSDVNDLFIENHDLIHYIGSVIIKRSIWLERDREKYFGSWYIHFGVIFQDRLPGNTLLVAKPYISVRLATQSWLLCAFKVRMISYPSVIWSLPISEAAKTAACTREPWRGLRNIVYCRAIGSYSLTEYRLHISHRIKSLRESIIPILVALVPRTLANALLIVNFLLIQRRDLDRQMFLEHLMTSEFYVFNMIRRK